MKTKGNDKLMWMAFWGFFTLCMSSIAISNLDLFKKEIIYPLISWLLTGIGLYKFIKCIIKYK